MNCNRKLLRTLTLQKYCSFNFFHSIEKQTLKVIQSGVSISSFLQFTQLLTNQIYFERQKMTMWLDDMKYFSDVEDVRVIREQNNCRCGDILRDIEQLHHRCSYITLWDMISFCSNKFQSLPNRWQSSENTRNYLLIFYLCHFNLSSLLQFHHFEHDVATSRTKPLNMINKHFPIRFIAIQVLLSASNYKYTKKYWKKFALWRLAFMSMKWNEQRFIAHLSLLMDHFKTSTFTVASNLLIKHKWELKLKY